MSAQCLLTLIVAPSMEELLVDWLLARDDVAGFSTTAASGHGATGERMSLAEQVAGRQARRVFQLHTDEATARTLLADLAREHGGAGVHYWLVPVLDGGALG